MNIQIVKSELAIYLMSPTDIGELLPILNALKNAEKYKIVPMFDIIDPDIPHHSSLTEEIP